MVWLFTSNSSLGRQRQGSFQTKLSRVTSHMGELWVWLRDPTLVGEVRACLRMFLDTILGFQIHAHMCMCTLHMCLHTCKYDHMHTHARVRFSKVEKENFIYKHIRKVPCKSPTVWHSGKGRTSEWGDRPQLGRAADEESPPISGPAVLLSQIPRCWDYRNASLF